MYPHQTGFREETRCFYWYAGQVPDSLRPEVRPASGEMGSEARPGGAHQGVFQVLRSFRE